ncbi:hypothetical protein G9A89_022259 [Geosiphon pyriformis]|nr:hypothetical protein G9A89_022259 [Geosiphon pyriformis]
MKKEDKDTSIGSSTIIIKPKSKLAAIGIVNTLEEERKTRDTNSKLLSLAQYQKLDSLKILRSVPKRPNEHSRINYQQKWEKEYHLNLRHQKKKHQDQN